MTDKRRDTPREGHGKNRVRRPGKRGAEFHSSPAPLRIHSKRGPVLIAGAVFLIVAGGCRRKNEPHKIIGGLPLNSTVDVTAARSIQQLMLLKRDGLSVIVPIINRLAVPDTTFPELTGPAGASGKDYSFTMSEERYRTASFLVKFFDNAASQIDPIAFRSSTTALKTVKINTTGSSDLFSYTESLTITLETAGDGTSGKRLTGTSVFNGSGYAVTFTFSPPGPASNQDGLIDGSFTGSGTGPTLGFSSTLRYSTDHTADGTLQWEGQTGEIHLANNGRGVIVTDQERFLLD